MGDEPPPRARATATDLGTEGLSVAACGGGSALSEVGIAAVMFAVNSS